MRVKSIPYVMFFLSITTSIYTKEPINVVCFELPPYCYLENDEIKGIVVDLYNEIKTKSSYLSSEINIRPLARAFYELDSGNTILLILTRTITREKKYQWIEKIYSDSLVFINSKNEKPINTFEEAIMSGTILTRQNAVTDEILLSKGITSIDSSSLDEEQQFKKLQLKRATTWFVPFSVGKSILVKYNVIGQYNIGKAVIEMELYIVGSKDIPIEIINEIQQISKTINKKRIYMKYGLD